MNHKLIATTERIKPEYFSRPSELLYRDLGAKGYWEHMTSNSLVAIEAYLVYGMEDMKEHAINAVKKLRESCYISKSVKEQANAQ